MKRDGIGILAGNLVKDPIEFAPSAGGRGFS
jgi:hypothetical protein